MSRHAARLIVTGSLLVLVLCTATPAATVLPGLLGSDLTDPDNNINDNVPGPLPYGSGYNWVYANAGSSPWFSPGGTAEAAFDVFDNKVGGGEAKWYDGGILGNYWVAVQFAQAYRLTHFTIASANDSPGRDPSVWQIQGSGNSTNGLDGTWTDIYSHNTPGASPWGGNRNQVIRWDSGADFAVPASYNWFRFKTDAIVAGTDPQIGEIELFGTPLAGTLTAATNGDWNNPGTWTPNITPTSLYEIQNFGQNVTVGSPAAGGPTTQTGGALLINSSLALQQISATGGTVTFGAGGSLSTTGGVIASAALTESASVANSGQLAIGGLSIAAGKTLTATGAGMLAVGAATTSGSSTFNVTGTGPVVLDRLVDGGAAGTLVKAGGGALVINNSSGLGSTAGTTFRVEQGIFRGMGTTLGGSSNLVLAGGLTQLAGPITVNRIDALDERFWTGNGDALIDPTSSSWTGLQPPMASFNLTGALLYNDGSFQTRIGRQDDLTGGWFGRINIGQGSPIPAGWVSFGTNSDDGACFYVDANRNGLFEASEKVAGAPGYHGPEARVGSLNLEAGTYSVYIGMFEGGGGAYMDARIAAGQITDFNALTQINPSAQSGLWDASVYGGMNDPTLGMVAVADSRVQVLPGTTANLGPLTVNSGVTLRTQGGPGFTGTTLQSSAQLQVEGGGSFGTAVLGNGSIVRIQSGTATFGATTLSGASAAVDGAGTFNTPQLTLNNQQIDLATSGPASVTTLRMAGTSTVNMTGTGHYTVAGLNDSGSAATLVKAGASRLILGGASSMVAGSKFRIDAGTVAANGAAPFGAGAIVLNGGVLEAIGNTSYSSGLRGTIFLGTPDSVDPMNLADATYYTSNSRVFTGDKAGTILALTGANNSILSGEINGWNGFAGFDGNAEHFVTAISGRFTPSATGGYRFRWSNDDRGLMFMDLNGDGAFNASEQVGGWAWDSSGTPTLTAGQGYNFVYMAQEHGGGQSNNFWVMPPGMGEVRVNPSDLVNQGGTWQYGTLGVTDWSANAVTVTANSEIRSLAESAAFGALTLQAGTVLTTTGLPISFTQTGMGAGSTLLAKAKQTSLGAASITAPGGSATIDNSGDVHAGSLTLTNGQTINLLGAGAKTAGVANLAGNVTVNLPSGVGATFSRVDDGGTAGTTLTKAGGGTLTLEGSTSTTANTTFRVPEGTIRGVGSAPLGASPEVVLSGGTLELTSPGAIPYGSVAQYRFENALALGADSSTNNLHGTPQGNAVHSTAGIFGGALALDGAGDCINLPDMSSLFTNAGTVNLWVKLNNATPGDGSRTGFVGFGGTGNTHYPWVDGTSYQTVLRANNSRIDGIGLRGDVNRTQWHMVSITSDPTTNTWKMYQNGQEIRSASANFGIANWYIGRDANAGCWLDGMVDEVMIFNRALSQAELAALYTGALAGSYGSPIDQSATHVTVTANSTLRTLAPDTALKSLEVQAGRTLQVQGGPVRFVAGSVLRQDSTVAFAGDSMHLGATSMGLNSTVRVDGGHGILGTTTLDQAGTLIANTPGRITVSHLTLDANEQMNFTGSGAVTIDAMTRSGGNATVNVTGAGVATAKQISDGGAAGTTLTKIGAGGFVLDNTAGTSATAATAFRIEQGTLKGVGSAPLGASTAVQLAGGTLQLSGGPALPGSGALHLDATDTNADGIADPLPSGAGLTAWLDRSGLGRNASNRNGMPTVVHDPVAGQPVVAFDGASQLWTTYNFDALGAYSVIAVSRYTGGDNERVVSSQSRNWLFGHHGNLDQRWYAEGWISTGGAGTTNWHLYAGTMTADADPLANFWVDGRLIVANSNASNDGASKPGTISLGAYGNLGETSRAQVAELLVYDRILNAAELGQIQSYLSAKYRLSTGASAAPWIDMTATNVSVEAGTTTSRIHTDTQTHLGNLSLAAGGHLTTTGLPMTFAQTNFGAGSTIHVYNSGTDLGLATAPAAATIENQGLASATRLDLLSNQPMTFSGAGNTLLQQMRTSGSSTLNVTSTGETRTMSLNDQGVAGTLTKQGSGLFVLDNDAGTSSASKTSLLVQQGTFRGIGAQTLGGMPDVTLSGGTLELQGATGYVSGLAFGQVYSGGAVDMTSPNPGMSVQPGPHITKTQSGADWPDNYTMMYSGQIYLDGAKNYHFIESIDDQTRLFIDGQQLLWDDDWGNISSSPLFNRPTGWYSFDLRMRDGGGGQGYVNINPGFQYNDTGVNNTNDGDHWYPEDSGSMNLFRTQGRQAIDLRSTPILVTANSTVRTLSDASAALGQLTFQNNSRLTTEGAPTSFEDVRFIGASGRTGTLANANLVTLKALNDQGVNTRFIKAGTGTMVLDNSAGTFNSAATTYQVDQGTLSLSGNSPLGGSTQLVLNGGKALFSDAAGAGATAPSGAMGVWTFNDATASDSSGNNYHGTMAGGTFSSDRPLGLGGQSIDFRGGNNAVYVEGTQGPFNLDTFSISAWVKGWPTNGWGAFVTKGGENGQGYQLRRQGGSDRVCLTLRGHGNDDPAGASNVIQQQQDQWHHIVAMYDSTTGRRAWYIDGKLDYENYESGGITDTNSRLAFGAIENSGWTGSLGLQSFGQVQMDDIYFYNRALTAAEVASFYTGARVAPNTANLNVHVTANSQLQSDSWSPLTFANLQIADNTTLSTLGGDMAFTQSSVTGPAGRKGTLSNANAVRLDGYTDSGTASRFVKTGTGTLTLNNSSGAIQAAATTWEVNQGTMATGGTNPLGGSTQVVLSGGTLEIAGPEGMASNALRGSVFFGVTNGGSALDLSGATYAASAARVFTGDKAGTVIARVEDTNRNTSVIKRINNWENWTNFDGNADNFVTAFSGRFTPAVSGSYNFYWSNDDAGTMFIDLNDDMVFSAGERIGSHAWTSEGNVTLTAGQGYNVIYMAQEYGGGQSVYWTMTAPGGSRMQIDPSSPSQAGLWSTMGRAAINQSATTVTVTANSTLRSLTDDVATYGALSMQNAATLSVTGARTVFNTATVTGPAGSKGTITSSLPMTLNGFTDGGQAVTLAKSGTGTLTVNNNVPGRFNMSGGGDLRVEQGIMQATGYEAMSVTIAGGTFTMTGPTTPGALVRAPLGQWTFDSANASDSSGNNYHGTLAGGATFSSDVPDGRTGRSLDLTSGNGYVFVDTGGSQSVFDGGTAMTISAWVKGWPNTWAPFVCKHGEPNGWQMRRHGGDATLDFTTRGAGPDNGDMASNSGVVSNGQWHFVTMVFDGLTKNIYIDGVLDRSQSAPGTIVPSSEMMTFGSRNRGVAYFTDYFSGKLDDISFFRSALTAGEVNSLYTNTHRGTIQAPGVNVGVDGSGTLDLQGDLGANLGRATFRSGTLTIAGAPAGVNFSSGAFSPTASTAGINNPMPVVIGTVDGNNAVASFTKSGAGTLTFAGGTVNGGGISYQVSQGQLITQAPMQAANLRVAGGANVNTGLNDVTISPNGQYKAGSLAFTGSTAAFAVRGTNLASAPDQVTLTGGTVTVENGGAMPGGLVYHLDASALTGLSTGWGVTDWNDKTGNGNNFVQYGGNQPSYQAGVLNGKAVVRFDGADDKLVLNSSTTPQTVFIVNNTTKGGDLLGIWGWDGNDKGLRRDGSGAWMYALSGYRGDANDFINNNGQMYINGYAGATAGLNVPHILAAVRGGSHVGTYNATSIGSYFGGREWGGDIAEVLVFNRTLDSNEMNNVGGYLASKYGLASGYSGAITSQPINLPTTHLNVTGTATLNANASGQVIFGNLDLASAVTLNLTGPTAGFSVANLTAGNGAGVNGTLEVRSKVNPDQRLNTGNFTLGLADMTLADYEWVLGGPTYETIDVNGTLTLNKWRILINDIQYLPGYADKFYLFTGFDQLLGPNQWQLQVNGQIADLNLQFLRMGVDETGLFLTGMAVPEPASLGLLSAAMAGLAGYIRRRRRA